MYKQFWKWEPGRAFSSSPMTPKMNACLQNNLLVFYRESTNLIVSTSRRYLLEICPAYVSDKQHTTQQWHKYWHSTNVYNSVKSSK